MAIPNLKLKYEVRAKVRIGKKNDAGYASSLDYFLSDDDEVKDGSKSLRVILPHAEIDDNFSTGLEWWVKTKVGGNNQLACYTKDAGAEPVALRLPPYVAPENVSVGEARGGQGRIPIQCPFRSCPQFKQKKGGCKPMGRFVFFIQGGRTDAVLELDTKSWNSIEALTATLTGARIQGPLTGRVFDLAVAFRSEGTSRFPVLSLMEVPVQINSDGDAGLVGAVVAHQQAVAAGKTPREVLALMLDQASPGWKSDAKTVEWIRGDTPPDGEVPDEQVQSCIDALLERAA